MTIFYCSSRNNKYSKSLTLEKESIREEFDFSQKSLKNVISQFKENVTEEIVTTMNQYQTAVGDKFQNDSSSIAR